jgi:hypothetical protein
MRSASRWLTSALQFLLVVTGARSLVLLFAYFVQDSGTRRHHVEASLFVLAALGVLHLLLLPAADAPPTPRSRSFLLYLVPAGIVVFLLFGHSVRLGLLSDDFVLVDRALRSEFVATTHEFVRPVPLMIWRFLFGLGAGLTALHAVNITLHAFNASMTAMLGYRLGLNAWQAMLAGVFFVVWPTQVEPVAWTSGVFDVLMTAGVLTVVVTYATFAARLTVRRMAVLVAVAIVALLTKETAVSIPLLIALVSIPRWMQQAPLRSERSGFGLLTAACASYLLWRVSVRPAVNSQVERAITAYAMKEQLSRTFGTLAVPFTAEWIALMPLLVAAFASVLVLALVLPLALRKNRSASDQLVLLCLAWCVVATAPAIGYLFLGSHLEGSRYLYLAASGWTIALASRCRTEGPRWQWITAIAVIALLVVCMAQTRALLNDWHEAARQRDVLLARAKEASGDCTQPRFAGMPATFRGAQLFRNGFDEAFRMSANVVPSATARECDFVWNGSGFDRRR